MSLLGLEDGETGAALVCFTDIAGFARAAGRLSLVSLAGLLKRVCGILTRRVAAAGGQPDLGITFSAHVGEIVVVRLEPISALDVLGDSVNVASVLGRRAGRGSFAISREVYQRLSRETQAVFAERAAEPVYLAAGDPSRSGGGTA